MDLVFENLQRIQRLISADPTSFQITDADIIFNYLENSSYESVLNKIIKNPGKRKRDDSVDDPDQPGPSRNESNSSEKPSPSSSHPVGTPSTSTSTSHLPQPGSSSDETIQFLKQIFPLKSEQELKDSLSEHPGLGRDALVSLLLDDSVDGIEPEPEKPNGLKLTELTANITLDVSVSQQVLDDSDVDEVVSSADQDTAFNNLCGIFPHLDPEYLKEKAVMYERDEEGMEEFINSTVGKSGLPTRKDFEKREARKRDIARIKKLKVSDFLKEYENPMEHFNSTAKPVTDSYKASCKKYLRKKFSSSQSQDAIDRELKDKNYHFLPTYKCLEYLPSTRKGKRGGRPGQEEDDVEGWDPGFLKEYIFLKLENKIQEAFSRAEENRTRRIQEAKRNGGLFTCACCFDDECLITEVFMCQSDHMFCGLCIRRGSEVQIGDGRTRIICFQEQCDNEIEMQVLKQVLKGKVYEKLMEKRQAEDVVNAKIQDLVQCPHCTYAVIMPDNEKLIRCGNPDCAKVSCRLCKEENHLPLRCDEVEKDEEVKARTKLENQMTEAMVRICNKCKKRFFKTEGCNLMHCDCGATMCYLCRKPVPDNYTHFYGIGASPKPNLCPLYSDNDNLHKAEVLKAAKSGKVGLEGKLKNDPTLNIDQPPPNYDPNKIYARGGYQHGDEYSDDEEDGDEEEESVEEEDSEDEEGGEDDYYLRRHQPFYNLEEYDGGNEYAVQAALHDLDEIVDVDDDEYDDEEEYDDEAEYEPPYLHQQDPFQAEQMDVIVVDGNDHYDEDVSSLADEEDVDEEDVDEEDVDEEDEEDLEDEEYFEQYDGANEEPEDDFQSPPHDHHYYSNREHHSDSEQYSEGDAEQMDGIVVDNNDDEDVSDEDVNDEDVDDVDDEDLYGEDVNDEDADAEFVYDEDLYGEDLNEKDVDEEDVDEEDVDEEDVDEEDVDEEDVDEEDVDEEDVDEEDLEDVEYFELYDGANEMPEDDFQSPAHDDHYYSNREHHSDSEQYSEGDAEQIEGIVVDNNDDGDVSDEDVDDIDDEDVDDGDVDDEDLFGEDVNDEDVDAEFVDDEDVEDEDLYGEDLNEKDVDEEDVNEEDVDEEEGHTSQYEEYDDHTDDFNEDFDEDHDDNGYDCDDHDYFEN